MSRNRSFSFESDDGHAQRGQGRYQDSPQRPTLMSPPPQYFATAAPSEPVSPISAHRPASTHSRHSSRHEPSFDAPRRSIVITNNNSVPPIPPIHRTSPTRETYTQETYGTRDVDSYNTYSQARNLPDQFSHQQQQQSYAHHMPQGYPPPNRESSSQFSIPRRPVSRVYTGGSSTSGLPLAGAAATPGAATPNEYPAEPSSSQQSMRSEPHSYYAMGPIEMTDGSPYRRSGNYHQRVQDADILPQNIVDDGDDGFMPEPKRRSMLPGSRERSREHLGAAAGGATAGAIGLGGLLGRKQKNVTSSGSYNAVSASDNASLEKSEWLSRQTKGNNKMRWIVGSIIAVVIVLAVIAGIVGGVLGTRHSSGGGSGSINNAADDTAANGDLSISSGEIKSLMNNKNLHKVFPGMDYTPWGVQYPLCLTYPPSQNNVTRDMAVLSQLTNAVRLYGVDCNQTEMVLHAIDRLQLKDMKVWLGVWIDPNSTTTQRQLDHMYQILADTKDHTIFKGVIIGNEALFRAGESKAESTTELINFLTQARSNFSTLGYDLTVSTSDLGDNWTPELATASDFVMSNVHPFFAGVEVEQAAAWTWDFWQTHDVILNNDESKQYIAETGWPSGGGTDCGNTENVCAAGTTGAVASVDNMNIFMNDWVCQALDNGTNYFWFSAFDEAWKVSYNEPGKEWEDKWGLMDTARNLKPGLKIPDCNGKRVP